MSDNNCMAGACTPGGGTANQSTATRSTAGRRRPALRPTRLAVLLALGLLGASHGVAAAGFEMPRFSEFRIPDNDPSFRSRLYTGATIGRSKLDPNTDGTVFDVEGGDDAATQLRLGLDLHNMLSVELDTSVLGSAGLTLVDANVKYSAASISALIYGISGVQSRSRREDLSAYLRVGYGVVKRSSAVLPFDESDTLPIVGLGAEYGFSNGVGVRAEVTRFDSDAVFFGIGAVYRFGVSPRQIGGILAKAAEPALTSTDTRVAADGRTFSPGRGPGDRDDAVSADVAGRIVTARGPDLITAQGATTLAARIAAGSLAAGDDLDNDGIRNDQDACNDTPANTTVKVNGCGVFDEVLSEVTFKSGSTFLTARARGDLDRVVKRLLSFPEVPVEVQAHTDKLGPADANLVLSLKRAEAVVDYLVSQQVNELQLRPRGVGEQRPLTSNATPEGRRMNRRVELVTLPNLSVAAMRGHAAGPTREALTPLALAAQAAASTRRSATAYQLPRVPALRIDPLPGPLMIDGLELNGVVDGLGFDSGSASLSMAARQALTPVVLQLQAFPDIRVAVMAHTDSTGSRSINQTLSEQRANAVVDHLVTVGISPERLEAEGYGEMLPRVQNVTARDRAHNRRVEIRVVE